MMARDKWNNPPKSKKRGQQRVLVSKGKKKNGFPKKKTGVPLLAAGGARKRLKLEKRRP